MTLAKTFKVTHYQDVLSEQLLNTYFYTGLGTASASDLSEAWMTTMFPLVKAIQGGTLLNTHLRVESLGNLSDWHDHTINEGAGYDTADTLPVFNAVGYTLRPANRAIKPGSKRYAMIPETVQIRGIISDATYIAKMESLRVGLDTELSTDETNFYQLTIVKRIKYEVPDSDPVRFAYRLPTSDEELVSSPVVSISDSTVVTHQVSRGN